MLKNTVLEEISEDKMVKIVDKKLRELRWPHHLSGYEFLRDGLVLILTDYKYINSSVGKVLYEDIGKKYSKKGDNIGKGICGLINYMKLRYPGMVYEKFGIRTNNVRVMETLANEIYDEIKHKRENLIITRTII